MAHLIVSADDLGADPDIDRGIIETFKRGILTSASLLVTTSARWEAAAAAAKAAGLPFGLHLSLTHGIPVAPANTVPDLVDEKGQFALSATEIVAMSHQPAKKTAHIYDQIRLELDAQVNLLQSRGLTATHLDSHQHVHMNPSVFCIVEDLALKYGMRAMRIVREPMFGFQLRHQVLLNLRRKNQLKAFVIWLLARSIKPRLKTNDAFYGVMQSGNIDKWSFVRFLRAISRTDAVWEVGLHPGFPATTPRPEHAEFFTWFSSPWRQRELELLVDPEVREIIEKERIQLVSYASLA